MGTARTHGSTGEAAAAWARTSANLVRDYPERTPLNIGNLPDPADRAELFIALSEARRNSLTALRVAHNRAELELPNDVYARILRLTDTD